MSETQEPARRRPMQLVAEQQVADPPVPFPSIPAAQQTPTPTTRTLPDPRLQQEYLHRAAWKAGVIGGLNVAAQILAARLILLLATVGAFVLAWMAIRTAQPMQLGAVALYLAGVILPLVWLSGRR